MGRRQSDHLEDVYAMFHVLKLASMIYAGGFIW
jgi:hypothetical protein